MSTTSRCVATALFAASLWACDHSRAPTAHEAANSQRLTAVRDAAAPTARDAGTHANAAVAPTAASVAYEGHAEGRGVDPPIHEFAPHAIADSWSGNGAVHLEIPASDGAVTGTIHMTGLAFAVRGHRVDQRVTAVLDQIVDATSAPAASEPVTNVGPSEGLFRGAFIGEIHGTTVRGTWEASATAGVHRRSGTLEATAAR